jgi:DNA-binding transcriptional ArsR family regulator
LGGSPDPICLSGTLRCYDREGLLAGPVPRGEAACRPVQSGTTHCARAYDVKMLGPPELVGPCMLPAPSDKVSTMVNDAFKALAHPIRRGIVERLSDGPATVGEATAGLGVSKPAISRHLKVLEEAGVVVRTIEGRTHRLGLDVAPLAEAVEWIDRQRAVWERMFDAVDGYLQARKENP